MQLHNLIKAVETANTPNTRIDGDVVELLNLQPQGFARAGGCQPELFRDKTGAARVQTWLAPTYMRSLDAALTMLPPGWRIRSLTDKHGTVRDRVILEKPGGVDKGMMPTVVGYGCSRAAAMLAACLRAKATDRGSPVPKSSEFETDENHRQCVADDPRPILHIAN